MLDKGHVQEEEVEGMGEKAYGDKDPLFCERITKKLCQKEKKTLEI